MAEKKVWSALPHKAYSIIHEGKQYGIGAREIWDQVPGAWNILQLVWNAEAEKLLEWAGTPENFPLDCGFVPYAVAFALQPCSDLKSWGDMADELTPQAFLSSLRGYERRAYTALIQLSGEDFWARSKIVVARYKEHNTNVVRADFRKGRN